MERTKLRAATAAAERVQTPERRAALADIHRMKNIVGLDGDEWAEMLRAGWGVSSSKDLPDAELGELRRRLHDITDARRSASGRAGAADKMGDIVRWRRRVWAVAAEWLERCGWRSDPEAVRTLVCRATRRPEFNEVSLSELRQFYHSWSRKARVAADSARLRAMLESAAPANN